MTITSVVPDEAETEVVEYELQTLRLALMTGYADQYATYIGTQLGIFEKYGIELSITEFVAGINTIDAVQNGTEDIGILADFALVNRIGNSLEGTNIVSFSEFVGSRGDTTGGLYVAQDYADDLTKLYDSPGIITNPGTASEYYNYLALEYVGLDPDAVPIINSSDQSTSLSLVTKGQVGAVIATGSLARRYEEYGMVLVATSEELGNSTRGYLMTTREFIADNAQLLANYLLALEESVDYINEHLEEVTPEISEKFGVEEDDFKSTWTNYQFAFGYSEEGVQKLETVAKWAYEHGKYDTDYNVRDYIDTSAVVLAYGEDSDKITVQLS